MTTRGAGTATGDDDEAGSRPGGERPLGLHPYPGMDRDRRLAVITGFLGAFLAVLAGFLPVHQDTTEVRWSAGPDFTSVTAPLVSGRPLDLTITAPCALRTAITSVIGAAYTLWMVKRVVFGAVGNDHVAELKDVNRREFWMLAALAVAVLWMGLYPKPVTDSTDASVAALLKHVSVSKIK